MGDWMVKGIKQGRYMEASWNYIAPSRTKVNQWIMEAWNGPSSRVSTKAIKKGASLCYMTSDLDPKVSAWDHCECDDDYDAYDWKQEVAKLSEVEQSLLYHSPLGIEAEKKNLVEQNE